MDIKGALKKIPMARAAGHFLRERITDCRAIPHFLSGRRHKQVDGPIKVAFICQYIPAWSKVKPVYDRMVGDDRFEPYLVCLPMDLNAQDNPVYAHYVAQGYSNVLDARLDQGKWLDLKTLQPAYVIYTRPYNALMPPEYSSRAVSKYSRVCLLMYGMAFAQEDSEIALNRDFLATTYLYFAETDYSAELNRKRNNICHRLKLQKTLSLGMPVADSIVQSKHDTSASWAFSTNPFRVMWTPRWTTDTAIGGTNFFTYKDVLPDFAQAHPDMDFLFRPHPLMFQHFIETGEMTQQEVDTFKARCEALPNIALDQQSEYDATLWGASVLVSDISGIMPEFLFTGKPLIFCASNMHLQLLPPMKTLLSGCYIVHNAEELIARLIALQAEDDPLQEKRREVIKAVLGDHNSSEKIVDALAQDYYG